MVFGPAALLVSTSVGVSKRGFLHSQSLNPVTKSPKQCKVFSNFFTRLPMSSTLNKTILGLVPFSVARERTEAAESLPLAAVSWIKSSQSASVTFRNNLTIHYGACAPCAQKDCCCFLMMLYYTLSDDDGPFRGEETKFDNNMDVTKSREKIEGKQRIPHIFTHCYLRSSFWIKCCRHYAGLNSPLAPQSLLHLRNVCFVQCLITIIKWILRTLVPKSLKTC